MAKSTALQPLEMGQGDTDNRHPFHTMQDQMMMYYRMQGPGGVLGDSYAGADNPPPSLATLAGAPSTFQQMQLPPRRGGDELSFRPSARNYNYSNKNGNGIGTLGHRGDGEEGQADQWSGV